LRNLLKTAAALPIVARFTVLSRVNPAAAAREAAKVWCRLPSNAGRRMDNRTSPGEIEHVAMDQAQLAVELWGAADAPIVYLVHGWGGWRGQLGAFVDPLVAQGLRVIGFDAASHGDSTPGKYGANYSAAPEIRRSFQAVVAKYGQPHGIVAHSLGCAVAAQALREGVTTAKLALIAPSPDMAAYLDWFAQRLGLSQAAVELLGPAVVEWAGEPLERSNTAQIGAAGGLPDALVIHDRFDKEVRYSETEAIINTWEKTHLMSTQGLGHHRILKDPAVIARVAVEMAS
jgi:pimeloyl-ACP methyl ester carboxylesterase